LHETEGAVFEAVECLTNGPSSTTSSGIDNLVSLCSYHHHLVHDEHFVLSKANKNEWNLDPP